jgi:hypothetical protein
MEKTGSYGIFILTRLTRVPITNAWRTHYERNITTFKIRIHEKRIEFIVQLRVAEDRNSKFGPICRRKNWLVHELTKLRSYDDTTNEL